MKHVVKRAIINALSTACYIALVALFFSYMETHWAGMVETVLVPVAMLLLFVFSAAFTAVLVFGTPVMWYLGGKKKEAISLVVYTLGFLFAITVLVFILLISTASILS